MFEEDSFATAPVRYALDDFDSDEELEASTQVKKTSFLVELTEPFEPESTVVFGLEGTGNVYLNSLENQTKNIGVISRVVEGEESVVKAKIVQLNDAPVLFVSFVSQIAPEESMLFTRLIFDGLDIKSCIILESFTSTGYISENYDENKIPPFLRVLQTSSAPVIKDFIIYQAPNMIQGLSAALINYSEIHSIPAYVLLTLQESVYGKLLVTTDILEAYTQGLKRLGFSFSFNENIMKNFLESQHKGRINDSHHRLYL